MPGSAPSELVSFSLGKIPERIISHQVDESNQIYLQIKWLSEEETSLEKFQIIAKNSPKMLATYFTKYLINSELNKDYYS